MSSPTGCHRLDAIELMPVSSTNLTDRAVMIIMINWLGDFMLSNWRPHKMNNQVNNQENNKRNNQGNNTTNRENNQVRTTIYDRNAKMIAHKRSPNWLLTPLVLHQLSGLSVGATQIANRFISIALSDQFFAGSKIGELLSSFCPPSLTKRFRSSASPVAWNSSDFSGDDLFRDFPRDFRRIPDESCKPGSNLRSYWKKGFLRKFLLKLH